MITHKNCGGEIVAMSLFLSTVIDMEGSEDQQYENTGELDHYECFECRERWEGTPTDEWEEATEAEPEEPKGAA